jgi:hypothetical protein
MPWVILTMRYGEDIRTPSESDLRRAVDELFNETIAGMLESDYAEHPNAWLRYGDEEGPVFVADASRNRTVTLAKYADQDDVDAVTEATFNIDKERLLMLWRWLAAGEIDRIRAAYPRCGW